MVSCLHGRYIVVIHCNVCLGTVREKAKELAALVKDKDRVKEERLRARRVSRS